jgi:hypothetical protein
MQTTHELVELRRLLVERFPRAHLRPPPESPGHLSTGMPALDRLLQGGLPQGELTELVGVGQGSGSAQVLHALLHRVAALGQFLALVDGMDSFDVEVIEPAVLARLLWVRCSATEEALKAADILLRDRNFPLIVLDLKLNPLSQLRKISSSVWHRFRRLQEQNGITVLVITPTQLVGNAACRVRVESRLGIGALTRPPSEILAQLRFLREEGDQKWLNELNG